MFADADVSRPADSRILKNYSMIDGYVTNESLKVVLDIHKAEIADALKDVDGTIKVTGYASTEGSTRYNKELSLKRAVAVKNALIKAGVDASKIKTIGAGPVNKFSPDNLGLNRIVTTEK